MSSGDKSPSSNTITPMNAVNFQAFQTTNFNGTAKSSGIGIAEIIYLRSFDRLSKLITICFLILRNKI